MSTDHDRSFFRVPCELQIRFRVLNDDEFNVFKSYSLRPSAFSAMRMEVENQIRNLSIRDDSKALFERAFQILINLDQRMERIEEQLQQIAHGGKAILEVYDWVHGDLGGGGIAFKSEKTSKLKKGDRVLVDAILPALPEYRFVAACDVAHVDADGTVGMHFLAIHDDDREFIHRFVTAREREILRARANERDKPTK